MNETQSYEDLLPGELAVEQCENLPDSPPQSVDSGPVEPVELLLAA